MAALIFTFVKDQEKRVERNSGSCSMLERSRSGGVTRCEEGKRRASDTQTTTSPELTLRTFLTVTKYNLIYKAQIVCVCVCVCVRVWRPRLCPFATEIGMHTRRAQRKVCVKELKIFATVPS